MSDMIQSFCDCYDRMMDGWWASHHGFGETYNEVQGLISSVDDLQHIDHIEVLLGDLLRKEWPYVSISCFAERSLLFAELGKTYPHLRGLMRRMEQICFLRDWESSHDGKFYYRELEARFSFSLREQWMLWIDKRRSALNYQRECTWYYIRRGLDDHL